MATKNNPDGTRVNLGALVERDLFEQFDELVKRKCLQKTAVLRRLVADFVETEQFTSELVQSNG